MRFSGSAPVDTRYTFTTQFLQSSAIFIRRARAIEKTAGASPDEATRCEHRGLVCATIMQCAAALETEAYEICAHGPGAHLGSGGIDEKGRDFLRPLKDIVDDKSTLERFDLILHLLKKPTLDRGGSSYQNAALVVRLRNELIHYKSRWGAEMDSSKLQIALRQLKHSLPPFISPTQNFFPHQCLSADCGTWALASVVALLESFYLTLGVPSRFAHCGQSLLP